MKPQPHTFTSQLPTERNITPRVVEILAFINYRLPFYAYLLDTSLTIIVVPADHPIIQTAATDSKHVWLNERFIGPDTMTIPQAAFVVAHEVEHYMADDIGKMHHFHTTDVVPSLANPSSPHRYYQRPFNMALDAIHNGRLVTNAAITMPTNPADGSIVGILFDGRDKDTPRIDPFADSYLHAYDAILKQFPPPPRPPEPPQKPDRGNGGTKGPADPASTPSDPSAPAQAGDEEGDEAGSLDVHVINDLPDAPAPGDPIAKIAREQTIQAASDAAEMRQPGSTPLHVKALLRALKDDRQVDWTTHLREQLTRAMTGPAKRDWTRFDRRRMQVFGVAVPPSEPRQTKPLAVVIDTSGSTRPYRERFITELAGLVSDLKPIITTIIFIDTRIQRIDSYAPRDFMEQATSLHGIPFPEGGGTCLDEAFEHLSTLDPNPAAVVTLTDSELHWPVKLPLDGAVFITATTGAHYPHPDWMAAVVPIKK